jgi:hypothetical protein
MAEKDDTTWISSISITVNFERRRDENLVQTFRFHITRRNTQDFLVYDFNFSYSLVNLNRMSPIISNLILEVVLIHEQKLSFLTEEIGNQIKLRYFIFVIRHYLISLTHCYCCMHSKP